MLFELYDRVKWNGKTCIVIGIYCQFIRIQWEDNATYRYNIVPELLELLYRMKPNDRIYINSGPLSGHIGYIQKYIRKIDRYLVHVINTYNGLDTIEAIEPTHLTILKQDEGFSSQELEDLFNK